MGKRCIVSALAKSVNILVTCKPSILDNVQLSNDREISFSINTFVSCTQEYVVQAFSWTTNVIDAVGK